MSMNYYSGMPYSNELYHHGVKGMHWYVRLYQNPDGSLTPLGRVHYGVGKAVKATGRATGKALKATAKGIGKAGKAVGKQAVNRVKARHPWMMSDEELSDRVRRVNMERNYQQAMRDVRSSRGKEFALDVLEAGGKTVANSVFRGVGNRIENKMRLKDELKAIEAKQNAAMARYSRDQRTKATGDALYEELVKDAKYNYDGIRQFGKTYWEKHKKNSPAWNNAEFNAYESRLRSRALNLLSPTDANGKAKSEQEFNSDIKRFKDEYEMYDNMKKLYGIDIGVGAKKKGK